MLFLQILLYKLQIIKGIDAIIKTQCIKKNLIIMPVLHMNTDEMSNNET